MPLYLNETSIPSCSREASISDNEDGTVWDSQGELLNVYLERSPPAGWLLGLGPQGRNRVVQANQRGDDFPKLLFGELGLPSCLDTRRGPKHDQSVM